VTWWDGDDFAKPQNRRHAIKAGDGLIVQVTPMGSAISTATMTEAGFIDHFVSLELLIDPQRKTP